MFTIVYDVFQTGKYYLVIRGKPANYVKYE